MKRIGEYEVNTQQLLGKGQFAMVYQAKHTQTGEIVAVKELYKCEIEKDPYKMDALSQEVKLQMRLKHPNVLRLIGVLQDENYYYLLIELCDCSLGKYLEDQRRLGAITEELAVKILVDILRGFQILNENDIIHRDIKQDNILVKNGVFKIADFGISKKLQGEGQSTFTGTPNFMSPQQMKSDKYTKCDIWAIGVLYYFMLFNKYPFAGPNMSVIYWNVCNKEIDFPSEISENSRDFISNCLKKEEIDRFSWDQLYKHQLIKGFFPDYREASTILTENFSNQINQIQVYVSLHQTNLQDLLQQFSTDGLIKKDQFVQLLMKLEVDWSLSEVNQLFNWIDKDKDEQITTAEIQQLFKYQDKSQLFYSIKELNTLNNLAPLPTPINKQINTISQQNKSNNSTMSLINPLIDPSNDIPDNSTIQLQLLEKEMKKLDLQQENSQTVTQQDSTQEQQQNSRNISKECQSPSNPFGGPSYIIGNQNPENKPQNYQNKSVCNPLHIPSNDLENQSKDLIQNGNQTIEAIKFQKNVSYGQLPTNPLLYNPNQNNPNFNGSSQRQSSQNFNSQPNSTINYGSQQYTQGFSGQFIGQSNDGSQNFTTQRIAQPSRIIYPSLNYNYQPDYNQQQINISDTQWQKQNDFNNNQNQQQKNPTFHRSMSQQIDCPPTQLYQIPQQQQYQQPNNSGFQPQYCTPPIVRQPEKLPLLLNNPAFASLMTSAPNPYHFANNNHTPQYGPPHLIPYNNQRF